MTECSPCGKFFASTKSFDQHRVGDHWPVCTRRCLETFEMEAKGMWVDDKGRWCLPRSAEEEARLADLRLRARVLTASGG
jgi:hypothetical protein